MTYFLRRAIQIALFLLPFQSSFAKIIYVNINNPTPGGGTSWATAFNNVQSAITVANIFDQIWIAKGTYYPSLPAGRSATFAFPGILSVYGGFNGTETDVNARNATANPTILSGDIGVAGDMSDNCYHVVTLSNTNGGCDIYSMTIRDGNANAGAPATTPQRDNTGGGVLYYSPSGYLGDGSLYNCTITNNAAIYGGGIGAYGDGGTQTNYGAVNCLISNNQAIYGGGAYQLSFNNCSSLCNYESTIFVNNIASSGNASAFGNSITNCDATTNQWIEIYNCLFYNEASPVVTNDIYSSTTPGTENYNNIVWTSGTPYTIAYAGGNKPTLFSYSDIDGVTPTGSNINADPLFVDAAGGNFHVSPCSPVVDAGYNWPESSYDLDGASRQQGNVDMGPYEQVKGTSTAAAPTVTNPSGVCQGSSAPDLTTDVTGTNLLWYTASSGGTSSAVAPTVSTSATGTTAYYVTQSPTGTCESPRAEIDVTILAASAAPTTSTIPAACANSTPPDLTSDVTGTGLLWYAASSGGSGSATAPTPSMASPGTTAYYVTQTPTGSCESPRAEVVVTISPNPAADFSWANSCIGKETDLSLTAAAPAGANLSWDFGGSPTVNSSNITSPSLVWSTSGVYPVTLTTVNGSCQNKTTHSITVNANPLVAIAPVSSHLCNGNSITLEATGAQSYQWSPATGLSDPTIASPVTQLADNISYTVTGTDDNGCSATASVVLSITPDCLGYYIPTGFTPNGDGNNDQFRVKTGDLPKTFQLMVFNRFGGKVFETEDPSLGWNGNVGSDQAPTGAYIFVLSATTSEGVSIKKTGTVMLIR